MAEQCQRPADLGALKTDCNFFTEVYKHCWSDYQVDVDNKSKLLMKMVKAHLTLYCLRMYHRPLHMFLSQYDMWFLMWKYYNSAGVNVDFNWLSEEWEYFGVSYFYWMYDNHHEGESVFSDDDLLAWEDHKEAINTTTPQKIFEERTAIVVFQI